MKLLNDNKKSTENHGCVVLIPLFLRHSEQTGFLRVSPVIGFRIIQNDQINMAVLFWYLVKSDLANVGYYTPFTGQETFYKSTGNTRPCIAGNTVCKVSKGNIKY